MTEENVRQVRKVRQAGQARQVRQQPVRQESLVRRMM